MIILIISGLMIVVLKYSRIAAEHTADTYVREQLELYLNSSIEQTLLAISLQSKTNCLTNFVPAQGVSNGVKYIANVNITNYYLVPSVPPEFVNCTNMVDITTEETHGMVMLEVEVTAIKDGKLASRILRRTLQRP